MKTLLALFTCLLATQSALAISCEAVDTKAHQKIQLTTKSNGINTEFSGNSLDQKQNILVLLNRHGDVRVTLTDINSGDINLSVMAAPNHRGEFLVLMDQLQIGCR